MQNSHDILEQLPGYIGWKDVNLNHLGCNRNLANILQLREPAQITGLKDSDLLDHTTDSDLFHQKNDLLVLKGNVLKGFHKSSAPYNGSLYYFIKKPLYDCANHIYGLIYYCHEFIACKELTNLFEIDKKQFSTNGHYCIEAPDNVFNLSSRELECLFYTLRGKTAKQAAEILNLSKRTVESYIENIKNKFGCNTKSDLLLIGIANGYLNYIPSQFVTHAI
jgi:DNA-binding CsgD family transcriptional regulator